MGVFNTLMTVPSRGSSTYVVFADAMACAAV